MRPRFVFTHHSQEHLLFLVAFVEDNATFDKCHYEFNTVFRKSCIVSCAKPREGDPIKLISLPQKRVSIALNYIIRNSVLK